MERTSAFELASWPCSDKYLKDPSMVHPAFKFIVGQSSAAGLGEIFNGAEVEKPTAHAILRWRSMEAHEKFWEDQETFKKFKNMFGASAKDGVPQADLIHVSLKDEEVLPCLWAPLTEFYRVTPKEGVKSEDVHTILDKYVAYLAGLSGPVAGITYGHVIEEPEQIGVMLGWDSIETQRTTCAGEFVRGIMQEMAEIAEYETINVPLSQFREEC
ncbi:hypothetical protein BC834DRAFT_967495 [Gloeopeniophorella convolvens]|nr:hypothetical protein BC834DRAFT_967495 [Gloeopeniophorella convolvens]